MGKLVMLTTINLTKNKTAIIDRDDYAKISKYNWYYSSAGYAVATEPNTQSKKVLLHRLVINAPTDKEVDHIDCDKLNCSKSNLRLCSRQQNSTNHKGHKDRIYSIYKGVTWFERDRKWKASIGTKGLVKHIGYFDNEKIAAANYNFMAHQYFGKYAKLNEIAS
jgi:HNH endonuclease